MIADLNFELPAYAHNPWDAIRSTYEYEDFLKEFVKEFPVDAKKVYPEGLGVQCPIETWSDDFSVAISGIPSMVNEFSSAEFMETHYHSQLIMTSIIMRMYFSFTMSSTDFSSWRLTG